MPWWSRTGSSGAAAARDGLSDCLQRQIRVQGCNLFFLLFKTLTAITFVGAAAFQAAVFSVRTTSRPSVKLDCTLSQPRHRVYEPRSYDEETLPGAQEYGCVRAACH